MSESEYQKEKDNAFALMKKLHEDMLRNPPPKRVRLPNFPAGANLPPPVGVNFYEQRDTHSGYLLCVYDVEENHYDKSNEPAWFASSLLQIRETGLKQFPPLRWVAVIIRNRAEHKEFEKSHKIGAIFNASEIFDPGTNIDQVIARSQFDAHPFVYDRTQPTPGEQQRWVIVERHAKSHLAIETNGVGETQEAARMSQNGLSGKTPSNRARNEERMEGDKSAQ